MHSGKLWGQTLTVDWATWGHRRTPWTLSPVKIRPPRIAGYPESWTPVQNAYRAKNRIDLGVLNCGFWPSVADSLLKSVRYDQFMMLKMST